MDSGEILSLTLYFWFTDNYTASTSQVPVAFQNYVFVDPSQGICAHSQYFNMTQLQSLSLQGEVVLQTLTNPPKQQPKQQKLVVDLKTQPPSSI